MRFSERFMEELTARSDIEDVVSDYVALNKRSGVNRFGLCPFHSEKTPSFAVNTETQTCHCFGCGKGGTVFGFIMEVENLSFSDAVYFLARRAGMEIPDDSPPEERSRRQRLLSLNKEAARFYHSLLTGPEGGPALTYTQKRGITPAYIRNFGLGYAPDSWQRLTDAMLAKGFTIPELIDAGLARPNKKGTGAYDYFRNRLMFPIIDVRGSVLGFSGRTLGDDERKYLNSPDTVLFSKSRNLFALNLAKKSKAGYLILAEGNVDVLSLHQAGFDSAVASLGTSLTPDQARLMARYTDTVIIAYDADAAGQKAAQRAISILQPLEFKVKVLRIPGAKDPDELIREKGPDAFRKLLENSDGQVEYRLQLIEEKYDLASTEGRVAFLQEAANLVATQPDGVKREIYVHMAAERAGVTPAAFSIEVERSRKKKLKDAKKKELRSVKDISHNSQPESRELRYENLRSARAEEGLLNLLFRFPELFSRETISGQGFSSEALGRLFDAAIAQVREGKHPSPAVLTADASPQEQQLLASILSHNEVTAANASEAMNDYKKTIRDEQDKLLAVDDLKRYAEELKKTKGYGDKNGNKKDH